MQKIEKEFGRRSRIDSNPDDAWNSEHSWTMYFSRMWTEARVILRYQKINFLFSNKSPKRREHLLESVEAKTEAQKKYLKPDLRGFFSLQPYEWKTPQKTHSYSLKRILNAELEESFEKRTGYTDSFQSDKPSSLTGEFLGRLLPNSAIESI